MIAARGVSHRRKKKAQTSVEYLILLGVLAIVALVGFSTFVPQTRQLTNAFYIRAVTTIDGAPPVDTTYKHNYP